MYKEKLIALLKGLECQHIDTLIEESPVYLETIGKVITKYTKIGAENNIDDTDKQSKNN